MAIAMTRTLRPSVGPADAAAMVPIVAPTVATAAIDEAAAAVAIVVDVKMPMTTIDDNMAIIMGFPSVFSSPLLQFLLLANMSPQNVRPFSVKSDRSGLEIIMMFSKVFSGELAN